MRRHGGGAETKAPDPSPNSPEAFLNTRLNMDNNTRKPNGPPPEWTARETDGDFVEPSTTSGFSLAHAAWRHGIDRMIVIEGICAGLLHGLAERRRVRREEESQINRACEGVMLALARARGQATDAACNELATMFGDSYAENAAKLVLSAAAGADRDECDPSEAFWFVDDMYSGGVAEETDADRARWQYQYELVRQQMPPEFMNLFLEVNRQLEEQVRAWEVTAAAEDAAPCTPPLQRSARSVAIDNAMEVGESIVRSFPTALEQKRSLHRMAVYVFDLEAEGIVGRHRDLLRGLGKYIEGDLPKHELQRLLDRTGEPELFIPTTRHDSMIMAIGVCAATFEPDMFEDDDDEEVSVPEEARAMVLCAASYADDDTLASVLAGLLEAARGATRKAA